LFRPSDVAVNPAGGFSGRVAAATYRGGHWEAQVEVAGLPASFVLHLPQRADPGDVLTFGLNGGWLLPG
ncbi:MAG: TOBE domain-containing protein, partial [Caulobacterales bacterium]|uniref:TOBE domain-containing protein n=1 Tax=Glycocaulis sp. TaxID=1969725 RepID=UPI003FA0199B